MKQSGTEGSLSPLCVIVSREEVQQQDVGPALSTLVRLTELPETATTYMEQVDIAFHGYDHDPRELFEIAEVRDYVHKLDEQFPFWLFSLSKHHLGLQCLMLCFLLPHLTAAAQAELHPRQLQELLEDRWGPALNYIADYVGLSEQQESELAQRSLNYFTKGRIPFDANT